MIERPRRQWCPQQLNYQVLIVQSTITILTLIFLLETFCWSALAFPQGIPSCFLSILGYRATAALGTLSGAAFAWPLQQRTLCARPPGL